MKYKVLKVQRQKQGFINFIKDIFGFKKDTIQKEKKIDKISSFNKAFLITFIPLYFLMCVSLFYKADKSIKNITGNIQKDVLFDFYIDSKTLSLTFLNENITFKIP